MQSKLTVALLSVVFAGVPALVGCDKEVAKETKETKAPDGSMKKEETKTVQKPDGTIEKTAEKKVVDKPGDK